MKKCNDAFLKYRTTLWGLKKKSPKPRLRDFASWDVDRQHITTLHARARLPSLLHLASILRKWSYQSNSYTLQKASTLELTHSNSTAEWGAASNNRGSPNLQGRWMPNPVPLTSGNRGCKRWSWACLQWAWLQARCSLAWRKAVPQEGVEALGYQAALQKDMHKADRFPGLRWL